MDTIQNFSACGVRLQFVFHPRTCTWVCSIDDRTLMHMKMYEQPLLDRHVDELELQTRTSNCLKAENIQTIRQLVDCKPSELLKGINFGRRTLRDVEESLARFGLCLTQEVSK